MIKNLLRPCPVCLNTGGEILHTQRFIIPEEHFLPESYDVVSCEKCGFVYADTEAKQEDYNRYYKRFSKYEDTFISSGGGLTVYDAERLNETASNISEFLPDKESPILDVGCANGGLLAALKSKGYNNLTGLDPSNSCVNYIIGKLGFEAIEGDLFNVKLNQSYECIILSHVLEHICDLREGINNIISFLSVQGLLYIEVPDASRYNEFYVVPYYYFDCEHINHFDEHSLNNLILQYNFEHIISAKKGRIVSSQNIYPSVYNIFRKSEKSKSSMNIIADFNVRESVLKYIETSRVNSHWPEIDLCARTQEKIILWGAGSYALRLLENTSLGKCNIIFFVDNDRKKQGTKIKDIPVYSPEILRKNKEKIIICVALYSDDILREIHSMNIENQVILMK